MIFMDLHKVYDALYRSICLEILEGYGVGPREFRILWTNWSRLRMVAKAGGYYRAALKGAMGVTQVYPLSPTIFNVVVDALVRHWFTVMVESVEEWSRCVQEGRHKNAPFCVDDDMVALSDP